MNRNRITNGLGLLLAVALAIGFLIMGLTPSRSNQAASAPAPDLQFSPEILDFGEVRQQQTLTGEMELVNTLPVAVNIGLIAPSCSCAGVELEPKRIEPNQKAKLKVAWKTGTRRDESKDQIVIVGTLEDEAKTTIQRFAKLKANVRPEYRLEPSELTFGPEGGTKTVRLIPDAAKEVKIKSVHLSAASGLHSRISDDFTSVEISCKPADKPIFTEFLIETTSESMRCIRCKIHFNPKSLE